MTSYDGKKLSKNEFKEVVKNHKRWLEDSSTGAVADLSGADLTGLDLRNTILGKALLKGTDLKAAILEDAYLEGANMKRANLYCITCNEGTCLRSSNLKEVNLNGATIGNADLSKCNLKRAEINGAILTAVEMNGANLEKTELAYSTLLGANLKGVNLRKADLEFTNLSEANLRDANLTGISHLSYAITKGWDIHGVECDYVYLGSAKGPRTPAGRDFEPGEFEELYTEFPSFDYYFKHGMHPLSPWAADQIAQSLKEQTGIEIELDAVTVRGAEPSVKLVVKDKGKISIAERKFNERMDLMTDEILNKIHMELPKSVSAVIFGDLVMGDKNFKIETAIQSQIGNDSATMHNDTVYIKPTITESKRALKLARGKEPEDTGFTSEIKKEVIFELKKYVQGEIKQLSAKVAKWVGALISTVPG